ncbi:MAG: DUF1646 family protein [Elusimicrobia bacterium]|nr:DUF1646 family protein [Elusimicrobiota bacterium]
MIGQINELLTIVGLGTILGLVLLLPFSVRWVEEELEAFLLVMGSLAVTVSGLWSRHLIAEALLEPVKISFAVLVFGFVFRAIRDAIRKNVARFAEKIGLKTFLFLLVAGLGFFSSVITAIIAALVLAEVITGLSIDRDNERKVVIIACYAIGLGAVLTPIGEPLATIATAKLAGPPYHADFLFLARLLWPWVAAGVLGLGLLAGVYIGRKVSPAQSLVEDKPENIKDIIVRAGKVYAFVAALVLLGQGFGPLVDRYLIHWPAAALYWVNILSAVLDNATLAAAEISPKMDLAKIEFLLLGLLISGGMLIPGNIPNIIAASKLGIKSRDWAKFAVPLGFALLFVYFGILQTVAGSAE